MFSSALILTRVPSDSSINQCSDKRYLNDEKLTWKNIVTLKKVRGSKQNSATKAICVIN